MSGAQHTPGPWRPICCDVPDAERELGDDGQRFWTIECTLDGDDYRGGVATVHAADHLEHGKGISIAERDANASLIAAAPELLAALHGMVEYLEPLADEEMFPEEFRRLQVARAALAKAEGRS